MDIRVGFGVDVHALKDGESLILGGVTFNHPKGTVAHSDGDVLIHAICDAILGAANMRDIGYHFPDTSSDFKNADSRILLSKTIEIVREKGWVLSNVDSTLCIEKPKLKPHIENMQKEIATSIGCSVDAISIKATTTERLGFEGREEGITAYATVLLIRNK